ncbi:hypothetical protein CR513_07597, partial [Mucuna pruriens]
MLAYIPSSFPLEQNHKLALNVSSSFTQIPLEMDVPSSFTQIPRDSIAYLEPIHANPSPKTLGCCNACTMIPNVFSWTRNISAKKRMIFLACCIL